MNEQEFQTKLAELMVEISTLPAAERQKLERLADETRQRHERTEGDDEFASGEPGLSATEHQVPGVRPGGDEAREQLPAQDPRGGGGGGGENSENI